MIYRLSSLLFLLYVINPSNRSRLFIILFLSFVNIDRSIQVPNNHRLSNMIVGQIVVFDVSLVKTRYRSVRILISVERKEVIGVIGDRVAREAGTKEKKKTQLIFFIIGLKERKNCISWMLKNQRKKRRNFKFWFDR